MSKSIDSAKIEQAVRLIIEALGDDPNREGLKDTPKRVGKMYQEVFEGMKYTNKEIAEKFSVCFEDEDDIAEESFRDMVIMKDIPIFSYCEHHLALMYNMKVNVAYIPNGRVLGLSKIARIADMVGKRLQLQERIGKDIAEIISLATGSNDVAVVITGEHSCMTARGIRKTGTTTLTSTLTGKFKEESDLRNELMLLLK
jgi:GTP cyclohydrolase I